jgi:cell division septum initiation protein DivIVA
MQLYIDEQLASIKLKLQQLLKQYQLLQKENSQLKKEIDRLKEEASQSVVLPTKATAISSLSDDEKAALNKKIDGFLKEIEQCLALINP